MYNVKDYESECETASHNNDQDSYVLDDPDLVIVEEGDVGSGQFNQTDPKKMVKYHLNWFGLPMSLFAIYYYGRLIFYQMNATLPTALDDLLPIKMALKVRYIGALAYFLACLLHRPFVYEIRNAEGPLLVATVLELYYMLNCKPDEVPPTIWELVIPLVVAFVCFMRRKPYWRIIMNPWSKDKSELIDLIKKARPNSI